MRHVNTLRLDLPPDRVAAVLGADTLHLDLERAREGVVSTASRSEGSDETHNAFVLESVEHARTKLGRLDRSATVRTATHFRYSKAARELTWRYESSDGIAKRLHLAGLYRIEPDGAGTKLTHEVNVEIDIPLIGGQIAKLMRGELDATMPKLAAAIRRHAG